MRHFRLRLLCLIRRGTRRVSDKDTARLFLLPCYTLSLFVPSCWSEVSSPTINEGEILPRCLFQCNSSDHRFLATALAYYTGSSMISACLILAGSLIAVVLALGHAVKPQLKFIWHCFIRPLGATDQRTRLETVCFQHVVLVPRV
jgi:hypothetical protein